MEVFIPTYFQALSQYVAHLIPRDRFLGELLRATQVMDSNDGAGLTNEEAFASIFYPAVGFDRKDLWPVFDTFYAKEFPKLRPLTQPRQAARPLIEWALDNGLQVAIATNPLFPRTGVDQRLEWGGIPVTELDYALVTTYEEMHATKSSPAYYREVLDYLGRQPEECLMVGDAWEMDIARAADVGIPGYWIAAPEDVPPGNGLELAGRGALDDLLAAAQTGDLM